MIYDVSNGRNRPLEQERSGETAGSWRQQEVGVGDSRQGKIAGLRTQQQLSERQRREERQQEVGDKRKLKTAGSWRQQEVGDSRKCKVVGRGRLRV